MYLRSHITSNLLVWGLWVSCGVALGDPRWHKGQPALVEENCRPQSGPISKPAGPRFDFLNRRIDRFSDGIGRLQLDCIQNPPQMRFDRAHNLDHPLQPAT